MGTSGNRKRLGTLVMSCVLVACITSCATAVKPTPTSTAVDSESAELAAAIDAFAVFNAAFDGYASGSATIDSLEPLVTPAYFSVLVEQNADFSARRVSGATSFDRAALANEPPRTDIADSIAVTLCRDLSRTKVIDSDGSEVDAPDRVLRVPLIVYLVSNATEPRTLLVAEMDQWPSPDYCS